MTSPIPARHRVAVVTVSYGSGGVLGPFLASVSEASSAPVVVVVADNKSGSVDSVSDAVRAARANYLPLASNLGYGGAMNAAVEELDDDIDWVLVSNPDVVLHPSCIDLLLARASADDAIGAIGPAIYTGEGDLYPSARAVPSLKTGIGHALFSNFWVGNPWTRAYRNDREVSKTERDTGWLSGACVLVRRRAFAAVGGFDPGYFMYFEDVDLGYRLDRAGYRNVYFPVAGATHTGAHATNTESSAMITAHHESARRFLQTKYAGPVLAPVRWLIGIGLSIRSAVIRRRTVD